jgi:hypothetical protein
MPEAVKKAKSPATTGFLAPVPTHNAVNRFTTGDLAKYGEWLLWRLKERYPQLAERNAASWLGSLTNTNDTMFLRTASAVGVAQLLRRRLDPQPFVEEVFVLCKGRDSDGAIEQSAYAEGALIYAEFKRWGEGHGASELVVERWSDVPREMIKATLGKLYLRESAYVKIESKVWKS